jgi:hypothetical protein
MGSVLSVASAASALCLGSLGSILSIGSAGSILRGWSGDIGSVIKATQKTTVRPALNLLNRLKTGYFEQRS